MAKSTKSTGHKPEPLKLTRGEKTLLAKFTASDLSKLHKTGLAFRRARARLIDTMESVARSAGRDPRFRNATSKPGFLMRHSNSIAKAGESFFVLICGQAPSERYLARDPALRPGWEY